MKKIYFILLAVLAIAACKKQEPEKPGGGKPEPEVTEGNITVIATSSGSWTADQTIGLLGANVNKESARLEEGDIAENGAASFTFSDVAKGEYVAYYPYGASNSGSVAFTVPAEQNGTPAVQLISGKINVENFDNPVNVTMKNIGAVLNISVFGGESGEAMTALSVKAAGHSLCGRVTYGSDGEISGEIQNGGVKVAVKSLNYGVAETSAPAGGVKALVLPVAIEASETGTVTYTVTTAKGDYLFKSKAACEWTAGSVQNISLDLAQADTKPTDTPVTADYTLTATTPSAWAAGQKIGLATATANIESSALAAGNITDNGKKGAFSFTGLDDGDYLAYFPSTAGNNGSVTFTVAASQNGTFDMPLLSADNGMFAPVTLESTNTSVDVDMKAVGAVLNFLVYGGPQGETMSSIKVKAEGTGNSLAGTIVYDSDAVASDPTSTSAEVSVSANQGVSASEAPATGIKVLVLPVNIAENNAGTVTYTVTTNKGDYVFKSTTACNWAAGTVKDIALDLGEADEDPYDPYDWRDVVNVAGIHIPAYSSFLPGAPVAGDSRSAIDAKYVTAAEGETAERKALAASDMKLGVPGLFATFSKIDGVNLSTSTDTDLADLMKIVISSCRAACPNDYPSSMAATGWATALLLAQLNYGKQEDILKTGLRIGESAVITGSTTYSAAHTGQIVASMLMSSLRSNADFAAKLDKLMAKASKSTDYPADKNAFANFLPAPPDAEITNLYDKDRYEWGLALRDEDRGTQAKKDDTYSSTYMRREYYNTIIGYQVSGTNSPNFYGLVNEVFNDKSATLAKEGYNRTRPFATYEGGSNCVNMTDTGQSYPSGHTTAGFLTGLVYSEIDPDNADAYYSKGYDYGISRVIVGVHYQSDVDAGILTAAAALSRYHASQAFINALAAAKKDLVIVKNRQNDNNNSNIGIGYGDNDEEFK